MDDVGIKDPIKLWMLPALAFVVAVYHLGANYYGLLQPMWHTAMHLALVLPLGFLMTTSRGLRFMRAPLLNLLFGIIVSAAFLNVVVNYDAIQVRQVMPTTLDQIACVVAVVAILEVTRRFYGLALPLIAVVALVYAFYGNALPPAWRHAGWDVSFMTFNLYMQNAGLFGIAPKTAATLIFVFVMLGAFLARMGTMDRVIELSSAFTRGSYGGSAKVAVFSSALMGSISGSSIANVVATGRFTIPMMKKAGFKPHFAAAVEAVASTGGLLMPPVMGAGAFIMAELLQISYWSIVVAAIVPAALYFLVVYWAVHFESRRQGIRSSEEGERRGAAFRRCAPYLLPVVILLALIASDIPPTRAALYTIGLTVALSWLLNPMGPKAIVKTLIDGAEQATGIACACACAGIIIGAMDGTGLAIKFSQFLIALADNDPIYVLLLGMVVVIILGMGLPATAAYILAAAVVAPPLIKLGFLPIAVHMFVFYYANLSHITPPVDLATYAAAGIAGSNPITTSLRAISLGAVAFVLPLLFIHSPVLLLQSSDPVALAQAILTAVAGTAVLAAGLVGWFGRPLSLSGRLLLIVAGGLLVVPSLWFALAGAAVVAAFFAADQAFKLRIFHA